MKKNIIQLFLVFFVIAIMSTSVFAKENTPNGQPFQEINEDIDEVNNEITSQITSLLATINLITDELVSIWNSIAGIENDLDAEEAARITGDTNLQGQIDTIELTPGPKGDKGDKGDTGSAGADGTNGVDGYTPIKGTDYFDGAPGADGLPGTDGTNGVDGYTPIKGTDYFDGVAGPKGDKGDKGDTGSAGTSSWTDGTGKVTTTVDVGIGTTDPSAKLDVDGTTGTGILGKGYHGVRGEGSTTGVYGIANDDSGANFGVVAIAGSTSSNGAKALQSQVYRQGTGLYWSGHFSDVYSGGTYNGLYADLRTGDSIDIAEYILDTDDNTEPGDVVVADPNNYESIIKSSKPYDTTVLGVISTKPHMVMGMELVMDEETGEMYENVNAAQLSLAGRVPVKVTDENGPVKIGDLLTTSSKPGYAMRCDDKLKCIGTILGKALEPHESGDGKIIALITLQ